jgi:hypothetical protein
MTDLVTPPTPRYYIQTDVLRYFWLDKDFKTGRHNLSDYGMDKIFINILENKEKYFHIKMFLKDGQTQEAFVPTWFSGFIYIHGMEILYDGRFNI